MCVEGADLSQAAAPAQGAAGLAEVVVIPPGEGGARAPDAVQVVQAAVVGELAERRKTAGRKERQTDHRGGKTEGSV